MQKSFARKFFLIFGIGLFFTTAAFAQGVSGKTFKTFIYSHRIEESSTSISFETNGTLLIDIYEGFGLYQSGGNFFVGSFWAPKFNDKEDLSLFLSGVVVTDFLSGMGIAFREYKFHDIFLFLGYAE
jgi:hypothetical protein